MKSIVTIFISLLFPLYGFTQIGLVGKSESWIKQNIQDVWVFEKSDTSGGVQRNSYHNATKKEEMVIYFGEYGQSNKVVVVTDYSNLSKYSHKFNQSCVSVGYLRWVIESENAYVELDLELKDLGLLMIVVVPFK